MLSVACRNDRSPRVHNRRQIFLAISPRTSATRLRTLAKNPAFTIIAVVALALGIGANSAIFSVVDAVLLRPLPFKDPEQLVMLWENAAHQGFPKNTPSPANFLDWQKQAQSFTGIAAMAERSFNLTGVGEPERLEGRRVSANLFELLGVPPCLDARSYRKTTSPGRTSFSSATRFGNGASGPTQRHRPGAHPQWRKLHGRRRHAAAGAIARLRKRE